MYYCYNERFFLFFESFFIVFLLKLSYLCRRKFWDTLVILFLVRVKDLVLIL
ncbi:hypothetical protein SAMN05216463_1223 [Xylanibacter ruminicola]|uniref:Uncharacterized protein n=1 Tax=Xylanibacter ruminicola TaxID=839 RepID=A0A1M6XSG3_XYLRU|nr:hypothetical protein SAMN05216463_1223 [Xylanibacter ruminicola]